MIQLKKIVCSLVIFPITLSNNCDRCYSLALDRQVSLVVCLFNNFFSRIFDLNKLRVALPVALRVASCRLVPVSRKPRKVFGPVKPFLVHFYLKTLETSCMKGNFLPVKNM